MTKIDIISGFLGAGKTTLIKKLLEEKAFAKGKIVIIENEFGEIGIDGVLLKGYGIEIKEMNSGCICCTIAGDFNQALKEMIKRYQPDRIIIEPSGVGKLSDVIKGCKKISSDMALEVNICLTVIDGMKYNMYKRNFAEFYSDQIKNAKTIILSRTQFMKTEELETVIEDIKNCNKSASLIVTDWGTLSGADIVNLSENKEQYTLEKVMLNELQLKFADKSSKRALKIVDQPITGSLKTKHKHADEVFTVCSKETAKVFHLRHLKKVLTNLDKVNGIVLRAKGIVRMDNNKWVQFDFVPGESSIKETTADFIGKICVIGEHIDDHELWQLFGL